MLLDDLARASADVAGTAARGRKVALIADVLRRATAAEVAVVVPYLSGELRQRRTGVGYATLRGLPAAAEQPTLTVTEVDAAFAALSVLSGAGSTAARRAAVADLMGRATPAEQRLLVGLVSGELRQGAQDGVMVEAVAAAASTPARDLRRALTVSGSLVDVAQAVLPDGAAGLARFRLSVGTPLRPMLAQSAASVSEAMLRLGVDGAAVALDWKLDGIRAQVHRDGDEVAVFTRTLDDVTSRLPEVVAAARALPVSTAVLDGEVIGLRPDGRPLPFQVTASRVGRQRDVAGASGTTPLSWLVFDALHLDGEDLVGAPGAERRDAVDAVLDPALLVPRLVTDQPSAGEAFFADAVRRGHEGVVVKSLAAPYEAGRRGVGWVKVKPRHTYDLVVLAAEWGHGRRTGWLSNLHLGARDDRGEVGPPGGYVMLGKTFKGLTDEMLRWQTERLLALADGPTGDWVVRVRPELVVEVAFDGVQTSPRYPARMALRFARVLRHRPDKSAAEADTLASVRAVHES